MNYRHAFHAGNFADVHKHIVLLAILEHLHKKPTPFFVLDTHAGRGDYDLQSEAARRGHEWQQGIGALRQNPIDDPLIERYLALTSASPKRYPGSPLIVAESLRASDRAVFVEKHPEEAAALRRALEKRKRVSVLESDGYAALKGQLPPKENRGLVLIDPPYESESEFGDVSRALQSAVTRWPNGVYALWFPIKFGSGEQRLYRGLVDAGIKKILVSTFTIRPSNAPLGLNGSGMLLINPPWQLDEQLRDSLSKLHAAIARDGASSVDWLAGE